MVLPRRRTETLEVGRWVVAVLSLRGGTASSHELVRATKVKIARLRPVLRELADRGYILRTGRTAASRYHLLPFTHTYQMEAPEEPAGSRHEPRCELEELVRSLRTWAFGTMRRERIPAGDCADLWQEAQLLACHRWEELESPEKWLRGTVRNLCIEYWRERRRSKEVAVGSYLELVEIGPTESSREGAIVERMHLAQVLQGVKPRNAELVWRRFGLEEGPDEIGAAMGVKRISVPKLTSRALKEVQQVSREEQDGKGPQLLRRLGLGSRRLEGLANRCRWLDRLDEAFRRGVSKSVVEAVTGIKSAEWTRWRLERLEALERYEAMKDVTTAREASPPGLDSVASETAASDGERREISVDPLLGRATLVFLAQRGGTVSMRELVWETQAPAARLRELLRGLEAQGYVLRTGLRASTRYHLAPISHALLPEGPEEPGTSTWTAKENPEKER